MVLSSSIVLRGFLGTDPKSFNANGASGCSFRLASSRGYYDRKAQRWKDSPTTWISVRSFRNLAVNVTQALSKGDPVVVVGELVTDEWEQEGTHRTALVLQASVIGHDLTQGVSRFVRIRTSHSAAATTTGTEQGSAHGELSSNDPQIAGMSVFVPSAGEQEPLQDENRLADSSIGGVPDDRVSAWEDSQGEGTAQTDEFGNFIDGAGPEDSESSTATGEETNLDRDEERTEEAVMV